MRSAQATQPQSPWLAPQSTKKKKENRTRTLKKKAADAELEDFVDWMITIASEPVEEEEMSSLATGFFVRIHKRATGSKGETTPISGGKRSRLSSPNEEA